MNKITIVGAGRVGETTAQMLAEEELCREIVLLDINEYTPQGVALDVLQTAPFFDFDTRLKGGSDPSLMQGSDLIIVTAGFARKPGMSRSDVLEANLTVIDQICANTLLYAPDAMMLMVTNPVDTLTYRAYQKTGWPRSRIFGQAGVLDSARMASFIAQETGFSSRDITTMVLGGHGDTMVPLTRLCTINGIPVEHFIEKGRMQEIIERTRSGGAEILALRMSSSAYDAPAAAIASMVDSISHNRRRILPCVAILNGEYGEEGIAMGVPTILAEEGIESIVEIDLNAKELESFQQSAAAIRTDIEKIR